MCLICNVELAEVMKSLSEKACDGLHCKNRDKGEDQKRDRNDECEGDDSASSLQSHTISKSLL